LILLITENEQSNCAENIIHYHANNINVQSSHTCIIVVCNTVACSIDYIRAGAL